MPEYQLQIKQVVDFILPGFAVTQTSALHTAALMVLAIPSIRANGSAHSRKCPNGFAHGFNARR